MKALAGQWHVYYVKDNDDEITPENASWDELTLFIEPKNNEIDEGKTKVLMIQAEIGYAGWWTVPNMAFFADYNKTLPSDSHKHFIRACFEEI